MVHNIRQIGSTGFRADDVFFVDSNVLFLVHGGAVIKSDRLCDASAYAAFIQRLRSTGCRLCVSILNLQEVMHLIERKHLEAYKRSVCNCKVLA
jgi:hypothetical protein